MGWWKIQDVKTGQVDKDHKCPTNPQFANAIPGVDKVDDLYNGDEPADIMGKALKDIRSCYKKNWNRDEFSNEMEAVFNFCYNPMKTE